MFRKLVEKFRNIFSFKYDENMAYIGVGDSNRAKTNCSEKSSKTAEKRI